MPAPSSVAAPSVPTDVVEIEKCLTRVTYLAGRARQHEYLMTAAGLDPDRAAVAFLRRLAETEAMWPGGPAARRAGGAAGGGGVPCHAPGAAVGAGRLCGQGRGPARPASPARPTHRRGKDGRGPHPPGRSRRHEHGAGPLTRRGSTAAGRALPPPGRRLRHPRRDPGRSGPHRLTTPARSASPHTKGLAMNANLSNLLETLAAAGTDSGSWSSQMMRETANCSARPRSWPATGSARRAPAPRG